jgi:hypothetical protein
MPRHIKRSRKSGNRRRGRKASRGLQAGGSAYNVVSRSGPAFAPKFPKEFSVSLSKNSLQTITGVSVAERYIIPLVEYLSYDPLNLIQLYTMYEHSKVTAVVLHAEISNFGTTPILVVSSVLPYNQVSTVLPVDLASSAGAKKKLVSGLVGKTVLSMRIPVEKWLGAVLQSSQFWVDSSQSNSLTPISVEEPTLLMMIAPSSGNPMSYMINWTVTFHTQFFNPIVNQI